ncbi:MAG: hypothetical protein ACQES9_04870 [Myxococcota bacterium]
MDIQINSRKDLVEFRFILPLDQIGYFKFILEGYEEFGYQSSKKQSEIVTWTVLEDFQQPAFKLLTAILSQKFD